jgi:hypothetical protein
MKLPTKGLKNLTVGLKELEQFVRKPELLQTGKKIANFGDMLPRELLANWLLSAVLEHERGAPDRMTVAATKDPNGGDGIICDTATEETWVTEHVIVPANDGGADVNLQALILAQIDHKRKKGGAAYASGKTLVVFLNAGAGGEWKPNRVARALPDPLEFAAAYVVGLHLAPASGEYIYAVAQLEEKAIENSPTWLVHIAKDFNSWRVEQIQGF